jgi:hypothetical protein
LTSVGCHMRSRYRALTISMSLAIYKLASTTFR